MLTISKRDVTGNLGPDNRPAAFCKSGDTVLFETRDCYDDRLMAMERCWIQKTLYLIRQLVRYTLKKPAPEMF